MSDSALLGHTTHDEARLTGNRPAVGQYLKSVAVQPRGQVLLTRAVPSTAFALISSALLHKRCISVIYAGRQRLLHPCAIVVRSPKLYLIACEDPRSIPDPASNSSTVSASGLSSGSQSGSGPNSADKPKAYQLQYMQSISVQTMRAKVRGFDLQQFIDEQHLEVPLQPPSGQGASTNTSLTLHIHPPTTGQPDALVDDLRVHPLAIDQRLTMASDQSHHILSTGSLVPTEALAAWILGRHDRVEVISPSWFRQLIGQRTAAMYRRYRT